MKLFKDGDVQFLSRTNRGQMAMNATYINSLLPMDKKVPTIQKYACTASFQCFDIKSKTS